MKSTAPIRFLTRFNHRRAFTLIELLVVLTITAILATLILPSIGRAREVARMVKCASNERQLGNMTSQYASDAKDYLPMPTTDHRLQSTGGYSSSDKGTWPHNDLYSMTRTVAECTNSAPDPYGNPRNWALGYGWFYWQGYLPAVIHNSKNQGGNVLGILECPGTPGYIFPSFNQNTYRQGQTPISSSEFNYSAYSSITYTLSTHDALGVEVNPGGVNATYDCYFGGWNSDYITRSWDLNSWSSPTGQLSKWKPSNAYAVDFEKWLAGGLSEANCTVSHDIVYPKKHGGGLNIQYIDGHVAFGGKEIMAPPTYQFQEAIPAGVYYSITKFAELSAPYQASSSGGCYNAGHDPQTGTLALWTYYETGIP